jgi:hypothetical protein
MDPLSSLDGLPLVVQFLEDLALQKSLKVLVMPLPFSPKYLEV